LKKVSPYEDSSDIFVVAGLDWSAREPEPESDTARDSGRPTSIRFWAPPPPRINQLFISRRQARRRQHFSAQRGEATIFQQINFKNRKFSPLYLLTCHLTLRTFRIPWFYTRFLHTLNYLTPVSGILAPVKFKKVLSRYRGRAYKKKICERKLNISKIVRIILLSQ
jgi:hypothetical protein